MSDIKCQVGDIVRINDPKDPTKSKYSRYIITAVVEENVNHMFGTTNVADFSTTIDHRYQLMPFSESEEIPSSAEPVYRTDNDLISTVPLSGTKEDAAAFIKKFMEGAGYSEGDPKYNIGDIVIISDKLDREFVIIKPLYRCDLGWVYEMTSLDNGDQKYMFTESALSFRNHSVAWEYQLRMTYEEADK